MRKERNCRSAVVYGERGWRNGIINQSVISFIIREYTQVYRVVYFPSISLNSDRQPDSNCPFHRIYFNLILDRYLVTLDIFTNAIGRECHRVIDVPSCFKSIIISLIEFLLA